MRACQQCGLPSSLQILYLNSAWSAEHGGALRLRPLAPSSLPAAGEAGWVEVAPRLGSLVLFWSHRVEHEVLPSLAPRFALSLWMHVDERQPEGWME